MIKHPASHLDHGLSNVQIRYLLDRFANHRAFFLETFELPSDLGTLSCVLCSVRAGDG
jgi:hypothetical protein